MGDGSYSVLPPKVTCFVTATSLRDPAEGLTHAGISSLSYIPCPACYTVTVDDAFEKKAGRGGLLDNVQCWGHDRCLLRF